MTTSHPGFRSNRRASRRTFLKTAGAAAVAATVGPTILGAANKSGSRPPVLGTGAFTYEANHTRGELPDSIRWGETHGVCVTLFDKENQVIAHLGHDPEWTKQVLDGFRLRGQPEQWEAGRFIHPHDACFDADGNIFVVEWVPTGRVTKLTRVA